MLVGKVTVLRPIIVGFCSLPFFSLWDSRAANRPDWLR